MKKAFTLVEIIFVIVVLSIVMGGTFDYILSVYRTYVKANSVNTMQNDLDITLTQIANQLSYRIKDSVIYGGGANELFNRTNESDNSTMEWISYSRESMLGLWDSGQSAIMPGWTGFIDRAHIDTTASPQTLISSGSNLEFANKIINELSNDGINEVNLTTSEVALIIPREDKDVSVYGWYCTKATNQCDSNNSFVVNCQGATGGSCPNPETFSLVETGGNTDFASITNTDRYYLAWSAYAIDRDDTNLTFRYNYRPWLGETKNSGKSALLLKNVTLFNFWQDGNTIWLKICIDSSNSDTISENNNSSYGFCKERVIY